MNAVAALCHFCEQHGPRILFTCQPFQEPITSADQHTSPDTHAVESPNDSGTEKDCTSVVTFEHFNRTRRASSTEKQIYGDYNLLLRADLDWPTRNASPDSPSTSDGLQSSSRDNSSESSSCVACRSMPNSLPGFCTNDHAERVSFVGSQYPYDPDLFRIVRMSCLRSLSCEVCPERQGPIFFGDDIENGYTLCHTFILRDTKARGFQQFYSIVLVSEDKFLLLSSYEFLVKGMKSIIELLQNKAQAVFETEQENVSEGLRLSTAARASMLPSGFLRQRAGSGQTRPLTELTADPNIFHLIHRNFVWLLKAQTMRCVEYRLHGAPSQDAQFYKDLLDERKASLAEDDELPGVPAGLSPMEGCADPVTPVCDPRMADGNAAHLQIIARKLTTDELAVVVHHVVVGEQIVVKGDCPFATRRILDALRCLIPLGCAKVNYLASEYEDRYGWQYNLLGVTKNAAIPIEVQSNGQFVMIETCSSSGALHDVDENYLLGDPLSAHSLRIETNAVVPSTLPSLVKRYLQLLADQSLAPQVLSHAVKCSREEWLNKSKLVYQYTRQHPTASEQALQKLWRVVKCDKVDKPVIAHFQAGLSKSCKQSVHDLCWKLNANKLLPK